MIYSFAQYSAEILYGIGFLVSVLFFTFYFKKNNYKLVDGIIITVLQVLFAALFAALFASLEQQKLEFVGVSYYGTIFTLWIIPFIYGKIRRMDVLDIISIIGPVHMLMLGFMKISCSIVGCCQGAIINGYQVPIQIIEAVIGFVLFIVLLLVRNKIKNYTYPTILIGYGIIRFCIEFFRFHYDFEYYFNFLSLGQIWSILAILLGLISIIFIKLILKRREELNISFNK